MNPKPDQFKPLGPKPSSTLRFESRVQAQVLLSDPINLVSNHFFQVGQAGEAKNPRTTCTLSSAFPFCFRKELQEHVLF